MRRAAGSDTYPSQSVRVLNRIVQPYDSHILFTCNTHTESREAVAGFYCAHTPSSRVETLTITHQDAMLETSNTHRRRMPNCCSLYFVCRTPNSQCFFTSVSRDALRRC